MTEKDLPLHTDSESGEPIIHPAGTFDTRPTEPGEIGYTLEGLSVTGLGKDAKLKNIGDTERKTYPAVISNPEITTPVDDHTSEDTSVEKSTNGKEWTVRRTGGAIESGWIEKGRITRQNDEVIVYLAKEESDGPKYKEVPLKDLVALSDEVADHSTDETIDESEKQGVRVDPLEKLPSSVRDEVLAYRRMVHNKREAEGEKNFAQAAEDGRLIYRIRQTLSAEARQFLGLD